MSQRFYINWPLAPGPVELDGPEAHHLANVCRLRSGDEVCLFNGDGQDYPARVLTTSRRSVCLEVLGVVSGKRELAFTLEVAAPVPKGDRAQFLVEKLTELGVTTFVPLDCRRAVTHPGDRKLDKLQRYVIEASKQCGRNVLMQIAEPVDWGAYCGSGKPGELRVVAHPAGEAKGGTWWAVPTLPVIRCAVGPEGGFTGEEIGVAQGQGWQVLDLGPRILRLETAAIYLAAWAIIAGPVPAEGGRGSDH